MSCNYNPKDRVEPSHPVQYATFGTGHGLQGNFGNGGLAASQLTVGTAHPILQNGSLTAQLGITTFGAFKEQQERANLPSTLGGGVFNYNNSQRIIAGAHNDGRQLPSGETHQLSIGATKPLSIGLNQFLDVSSRLDMNVTTGARPLQSLITGNDRLSGNSVKNHVNVTPEIGAAYRWEKPYIRAQAMGAISPQSAMAGAEFSIGRQNIALTQHSSSLATPNLMRAPIGTAEKGDLNITLFGKVFHSFAENDPRVNLSPDAPVAQPFDRTIDVGRTMRGTQLLGTKTIRPEDDVYRLGNVPIYNLVDKHLEDVNVNLPRAIDGYAIARQNNVQLGLKVSSQLTHNLAIHGSASVMTNPVKAVVSEATQKARREALKEVNSRSWGNTMSYFFDVPVKFTATDGTTAYYTPPRGHFNGPLSPSWDYNQRHNPDLIDHTFNDVQKTAAVTGQLEIGLTYQLGIKPAHRRHR